jgi:hypothetical protein
MKTNLGCVVLLGICVLASPAGAETRVFFDQDEYIVSAVGETFDVQVLIDADFRTEELEPLPGGLFSFGAKMTFDSSKAELSGPAALQTVGELDHFGFSAGAFTEVDEGLAASKGNIDQIENPLVPYQGNLLMTLTVTNMASAVDQYPLQLDFFRTLGASESLFLDGAGNVLDSEIVFEPALVRVVPEPSAMSLLAGGMALFFGLRRRTALPHGQS